MLAGVLQELLPPLGDLLDLEVGHRRQLALDLPAQVAVEGAIVQHRRRAHPQGEHEQGGDGTIQDWVKPPRLIHPPPDTGRRAARVYLRPTSHTTGGTRTATAAPSFTTPRLAERAAPSGRRNKIRSL